MAEEEVRRLHLPYLPAAMEALQKVIEKDAAARKIQIAVVGPWSEPDTLKRWAKKFQVTPKTLSRWAKSGRRIRIKKLSRTSWCIHVEDLPRPRL